MARHINITFWDWNGNGDIIPKEVILNENFDVENKIAPSAELKDNQTDPLKFGFLCRILEHGVMDYKKVGLESILEAWLNRTLIEDFNLDEDLFYKYELHKAEVFVEEIIGTFKKLRGSTFKRVQSPPIIITSKSSFGYDYRESILPAVVSVKARKLQRKIAEKRYY